MHSGTDDTKSFTPANLLRLPSSIRNVFDAFPLITYQHNALPQRVRRARPVSMLYMFAIDDEPFSPNPACLKWQAYLMARRIPIETINSNNHASPNGALPFMIPARIGKESQPQAVVSSKIRRWVETQTKQEDVDAGRDEVLMSLVDQNIRAAWLFFIYLKSENFQSIAHPLYISTASSNVFVQKSLSYQLQQAAKEQVLKTRSRIDEHEILAAADVAFESLQTILGDREYFSKSQEPGILDTTLFSYTYLILKFTEGRRSDSPIWRDQALFDVLAKYSRLIEHAERLQSFCLDGVR